MKHVMNVGKYKLSYFDGYALGKSIFSLNAKQVETLILYVCMGHAHTIKS